MQMQQLRYFTAIARAGSFSQAAKDLFMTQPPLSASIANLEDELDTQLFTRHSRGVSLTPAGEAVLRYAERVTAGEEDLRRVVSDLQAGRAGNIVIGYSHTLSVPLIPQILRKISQVGSTLGWTLRETDPVSVIESVLEGECDVGLVATAASDDIQTLHKPYLVVDRIGEIPLVLALPPSMTWLDDRISLEDIEGWEFAVPLRSLRSGLRVELATAFLRAGLVPPLTRDVPSLRAAIPPVSAGALLSFVPQNFQSLFHPGLVTFRPVADGPRDLEVSLVYRQDSRQTPVVRRFRRILDVVARDGDLVTGTCRRS